MRDATAVTGKHGQRRLATLLTAGLCLLMVGGIAEDAQAAPQLSVQTVRMPDTPRQNDQYLRYTVTVGNTGADPTSGTTTVAVSLPAGLELAAANGSGWTCSVATSSCTTSAVRPAGGSYPPLTVHVWVYPDLAPGSPTVGFAASGGGAATPASTEDSFAFAPATPFDIVDFSAGTFDAFDDPDARAGGHPFSATSTLRLTTRLGTIGPDLQGQPFTQVEDARNLVFELPPGFVANPQAVPTACTIDQVRTGACPESAAVGGVTLKFADEGAGFSDSASIFRVKAERGYPAAFAFRPVNLSGLTFVLRPKLRSNGDYGITVISPLAAQTPAIVRIEWATLCTFGADLDFGSNAVTFIECRSGNDPDAFDIPFLTNPTDCPGTGPVTRAVVDSHQHPGAFTADGFPDVGDPNWKRADATSPPTTGCASVPFEPEVSVSPTSTVPDAASGLDVDLDVPQDGLLDPDGTAPAHLKRTVVELPEGFSVNPSAATGLRACSDAQMAQDRLTAPECPDASKLGSVSVTSPLVDEPLTGFMYLGTPKSTDPTSGEMLRLWVAVRNDNLGLSAKLAGSTVADPVTGRLTATFDDNPRVPFDSLKVRLRGGARGVLAGPQDCGEKTSTATLSPWSATGPVVRSTVAQVTGDCGFGFAPGLGAGMASSAARASSAFSFEFSRQDGEHWIDGLTAQLPRGLLASVKDVSLCTSGQADAGVCPATSRIGTVDATAGSGDPFVLEQKGTAYLTEGYKGCPYGLAVKVPVVAGPFDGTTPATDLGDITVRQAVCVDRSTAQVTAISDRLPTIWHGIPLRVRSVTVLIDRPGFMLNPSNCEAKQVGATFDSERGATANAATPFQASGCANLPFKPKLSLALTGRKQVTTGKHPGIKATVTQTGTSEAGIEQAVVRLPKSLALDPENAQALCEFADGTKPDLENHCPKGSIVGRARAKTPLLRNDLVGNVYFVKNVRRDPKTGNQIRTLPMIIVALRGEIAVNLKGESSTMSNGRLVNTFASVPDAPISRFNLNIAGGNTGIIAVTRTRKAKINLCTGRHIAETDIDAQNGRRHDTNVRMKTPCTKKQTKAAKRQAKRAAAKARNQLSHSH